MPVTRLGENMFSIWSGLDMGKVMGSCFLSMWSPQKEKLNFRPEY